MATVVCTVTDAQLLSLGTGAQVVFSLTTAWTSGYNLIAAKPIAVPLSPTGTFAVELAANTGSNPTSLYDVRVDYFDAASTPNYIRSEHVGTMFVPVAGGNIGDLITNTLTASSSLIWWDANPPSPWPVGLIWVNSVTGAVQRMDA